MEGRERERGGGGGKKKTKKKKKNEKKHFHKYTKKNFKTGEVKKHKKIKQIKMRFYTNTKYIIFVTKNRTLFVKF